MIDERKLREMLERRAATISATPTDALKAIRRARWRLARNAAVGALVGLGVLTLTLTGLRTIQAAPTPADTPAPTPADTPTPTPIPGHMRSVGSLAYGVNGDIYVADWDGSSPVRIANGVPVDGADECGKAEHRTENIAFGTAWSPDGRYLAYWDWGCPVPANAWGTVIISDPEGNVVASFPGQGWTISWSPDSARVAIWDSWGEGDTTIGVYGLDGVRQAALTVPASLMPTGDISPVWSRDGASLLLPGVQVPLDGRKPLRLPADDLTRHWFAAYSPDGSHVAYMDHRSLVVAEAAGSDAREVGAATEFWEAAWSPSGDRVAFVHDDTELRVRNVTTGTETSLTAMEGSDRLRVIEFSPDGDRVLFSRTEDSGVGSLWSINADGSDLRRLITRIDWADWRPRRPTT
jgi:Tol biopolymer transport system component